MGLVRQVAGSGSRASRLGGGSIRKVGDGASKARTVPMFQKRRRSLNPPRAIFAGSSWNPAMGRHDRPCP